MSNNNETAPPTQAAQALISLCSAVLPVWERHLSASRAQSETAVSQMLQAFSDIGPHINMAERQSQQITDALTQADGGVTGLVPACEARLAPLINDASLPAPGREALVQVLQMVREAVGALQSISQPFAHETQMVAVQVERMYTGFQYQDRISQMMALLEGDMSRLHKVLDGTISDVPQIESWMSRLESQYAMAEQRDSHAGTNAAQAAGPQETDFF
jgi:ABC-type transporter Mla subunit MlaD